MNPSGAEQPTRAAAWLRDAERVDLALYAAIARTPAHFVFDDEHLLITRASRSVPRRSSPRSAAAAARRAAASGLVSVGVTAAIVNLALKPLGRRRRPDRLAEEVPVARHTRMPISTAFPSGHSATAFAFATAVGHVLPAASLPLHGLAALVAYSRVHAGVHYPADVVSGALAGTVLSQLTTHALDRR